MSIHLSSLSLALVLALTGNAHAHDHRKPDTNAKHEGHGHAAHEHGVAHADIAIDADGATIELTVTGADLVGFEGEADNAEALAMLEAGRKTLVDGAALFAFAPADRCKAGGPGELTDPAADGDKHDHDSSAAGHKTPHRRKAPSSPADWRVTYRYTCKDGGTLTGISTTVFTAIPSLAEVRVQLVAPSAQAGATLTPQAPQLRYAGD